VHLVPTPSILFVFSH